MRQSAYDHRLGAKVGADPGVIRYSLAKWMMTLSDDSQLEIRGLYETEGLFGREAPASTKGNPAAWGFARTLIDHGAFILSEVHELREGTVLRDLITSVVLRRALVTAEAVRVLLEAGLEEPAFSEFRTLLDIHLNLVLVTRDDTDHMAKRLGAYHYLGARRQFSKVFSDPETREMRQRHEDHLAWSRETSRKMKDFFESPGFADVRDEVAGTKLWHGHATVEAAFAAADMIKEYVNLYALYSPFTHASNVDFDLADIDQAGRPQLKALVQRDPDRTLNLLRGMCLKLVSILKLFLEDRGDPEYQGRFRMRVVGSGWEEVKPLTAAIYELHAIFGSDEADEDE